MPGIFGRGSQETVCGGAEEVNPAGPNKITLCFSGLRRNSQLILPERVCRCIEKHELCAG
jgi:hypothetical protein